MTDEVLRRLERRWRASGEVRDEAALLRERLRLGDLSRDRFALAYWVGEPGARAASEGGPHLSRIEEFPIPIPPGAKRKIEAGCRVLAQFPRDALVRVVLAVARFQIADRSPQEWDDEFRRVSRALSTVETWLLEPTDMNLMEVRFAEEDARQAAWGDHPETGMPLDGFAETPIGRVAEYACKCVHSLDAHVPTLAHVGLGYAAVWQRWPQACSSLREEVAPWALGYFDPVRQRCAPDGSAGSNG